MWEDFFPLGSRWKIWLNLDNNDYILKDNYWDFTWNFTVLRLMKTDIFDRSIISVPSLSSKVELETNYFKKSFDLAKFDEITSRSCMFYLYQEFV